MSTSPPRAARRPRTVQRVDGAHEDPYAWLRDRDDPDVIAHLEANNAHVDAVLGDLDDLRETLFQEIRTRVVETDVSVPVVDGPRPDRPSAAHVSRPARPSAAQVFCLFRPTLFSSSQVEVPPRSK